jgi:hypothetical protein
MKAVRLVAFVLLACSPLEAQTGWFPFTLPWDDASKTAIDASDLLVDSPGQDPSTVIDARGFVRASRDGHFYFEKTGRRARFWGVNFTFNADFPPCPDEPLRSGEYPDPHVSEKVARRLAKLGVNVVRFHHMDFFAAPNGIFDPKFFPNETQHLDPGQLRRLDYLTYQLRRNGIYVNLNLKVARHFGPGDGLADTNLFTGNLAYFQGVSHWNARMIELQKDYARQLLEHRNPYTGLTYAKDPGVLCFEIANEDSLFGNLLNDGGLNYIAGAAGSLPRVYSEELDALWNDWLRARYGDDAALGSAWKASGGAVDTSDRMRNGGFESGMSDWTVQRLEAAQAQPRIESGAGPDGSAALRVDVTADGVTWHVQAFQLGHAVVKGGRYEIAFYARAASPGDVTVNIMKGAAPWQNYGLSKTFALSTEWRRYTASFQANETDPSTVRPTFDLGAHNNTIWLDQVEFRQSAPRDLDAEERLASGTVRRPVRSALATYTETRVLDLFRFYSEIDEKYFAALRRFLKEDLGAEALVTGTAPWWAYLGDVAVQSKLDFVDGHYYWDHPSWTGVPAWSPTGWRIRNQPQINALSDLNALAALAVEGKPFTVSEYNYVFPNRYALEGPLTLALVANLQDWDAVYMFDYASSTAAFDDESTSSFFSMAGNPIKSAQLPIAARLFLSSQSAVATDSVAIDVGADEPPLGYAQGLVGASRLLADKGLDARASLVAKLRIRRFDASTPTSVRYSVPSGSVTSSNGELLWDTSDSQAAYLRVRGGAAAGAIGFLRGHSIDLGDWSFEPSSAGPDHLAVLLQARDGVSLRESRRMILSVWSEHANTGMVWNDEHTTVENRWGTAPTLVRPALLDLVLRFAAARALRLYPLDEKGARRKEIAADTSVAGERRFAIDTGRDATVWYEIEINDAAASAPYAIGAEGLAQLYTDPTTTPRGAGWVETTATRGRMPEVVALLESYGGAGLVSVARLPPVSPALAWSIPVIRSAETTTALAFVNTSPSSSTVTLRLRSAAGTVSGEPRPEALEPGESRALFIEERFDLAREYEGTLELESTQPLVALALRSTTSASRDLLFTPYPGASPASASAAYFPHLVRDGAYRSEIVVWNPEAGRRRARLEFFTAAGAAAAPAPVEVELDAGQLRRVVVAQDFAGYARLTLVAGTSLPRAVGIVTRREGGAAVSEVAIAATAAATDLALVVPERPWQRAALALLNPSTRAVTIELELTAAEGALAAPEKATLTLEAGEKRALFLYQLLPRLPTYLNGVLRIRSDAPIAALSLLGITNARGDFLLASLSDGADPAAGGRAIVPRFAAGEGYRTVFYLLEPRERSEGEIRFFGADGKSLAVPLR